MSTELIVNAIIGVIGTVAGAASGWITARAAAKQTAATVKTEADKTEATIRTDADKNAIDGFRTLIDEHRSERAEMKEKLERVEGKLSVCEEKHHQCEVAEAWHKARIEALEKALGINPPPRESYEHPKEELRPDAG